MKFTRTLALAAAATLALSMTACDDSSSPDAAVEIRNFSITMGSQEQSDLPSLLSIRKNGAIFIKDLDAVPANVENIDVILYEDFNAASGKLDKNNAKLWSPDAFVTDGVWKTSSLATKYILPNAAAKATATKFAKISAMVSDIETRGDLDDVIDGISASQWVSTLDVVTGDVFAIKVKGDIYAIAEVTKAEAVDHASTNGTSDQKAVNLKLLIAQKL